MRHYIEDTDSINPLTAGAAYILVFIFYKHIMYHNLNMLKIKYDINQQDLKKAVTLSYSTLTDKIPR